jgi:hypothetical protein
MVLSIYICVLYIILSCLNEFSCAETTFTPEKVKEGLLGEYKNLPLFSGDSEYLKAALSVSYVV